MPNFVFPMHEAVIPAKIYIHNELAFCLDDIVILNVGGQEEKHSQTELHSEMPEKRATMHSLVPTFRRNIEAVRNEILISSNNFLAVCLCICIFEHLLT